ncbi:uncharacterized protein LOC114742586 [Neltuma alba]|uniref:uncharacterized protein LOC114742586 n=1 Tax=Neltuma alba TaxID=207710 RepID=UPI0010A43366|nr:uncharacterized protein LOC114742586 [Prosopis alba]XP_028786644.1 uncharacterized protein LOC114742586 [Prosopis alba]
MHQSSSASNNFVIDENYLLHGRRSASVPPPNPEDDQSSSPPSSPASASASSNCVSDEDGHPIPSPSQSEWRLRVASEGWKLLKVRFEAIRDGVVRVASRVRDYAICMGAFWSITYITGAALATAALLVYVGIQRRRRRRRWTLHQQRLDHMACLLRERDERISELLLQIAHLNELLSSRRKVPVLRING